MRDLPKYVSHKTVVAAKIFSVTLNRDDSAIIEFEDNLNTIVVNPEYVQKHNPEAGGYYVQYEDGYESWSPAYAFEQGYTRVESK